MRQRTANPNRGRLDLRVPTDMLDSLDEIADRRTFGNRSALVERYLTEAIAAETSAA